MSRVILGVIAGMLALLAFASVAGATIIGYYEPPVPRSLEN